MPKMTKKSGWTKSERLEDFKRSHTHQRSVKNKKGTGFPGPKYQDHALGRRESGAQRCPGDSPQPCPYSEPNQLNSAGDKETENVTNDEEHCSTKEAAGGSTTELSSVRSRECRKRASATVIEDVDANDVQDEGIKIDHEVLRAAILDAVEKNSISAEEIYNNHLTMDSIKGFFEKHLSCLESWPGVTSLRKCPLDVLQVAFVISRAQLREKTIKEVVDRKKLRNKEDLKKAHHIYKLRKSSGMDPKAIMKSLCEELKIDPKHDTPSSTAIPAPNLQATIPQDDTREKSDSHPLAKASQKSQLEVEPQGKYCAEELKLSLPSPEGIDSSDGCHESTPNAEFDWPKDLSFPVRGKPMDAIDRLAPPLELPFPELSQQVAPIAALSNSEPRAHSGRKRGRPHGSMRGSKGQFAKSLRNKTNFSVAMADAYFGATATDFYCPKSPEKKQKGPRGVACPIKKE